LRRYHHAKITSAAQPNGHTPRHCLASTLSKLYAEISKREELFLYIFVGMTCDSKHTTRNSLLFLTLKPFAHTHFVLFALTSSRAADERS